MRSILRLLSVIIVGGVRMLVARGPLDPVPFRDRCVARTRGLEVSLWFRVDALPAGSEHPLKVSLERNGEVVYTDSARLRVYEELTAPPPVRPEHFRFYLHYGPLYRMNRWDELAEILRRAGINAILVMAGETERLQAMQARGFYTIAQRAGSYGRAVAQLNQLLDEGQGWFEREDGGAMRAAVPHADAVLWDFEPGPGHIVTNPATLDRFRRTAGLDPATPLDEQTVRDVHFQAWIAFRQRQFAEAVRHWAEWSRSLKPGIETLLTEGRVNGFDPSGQIDYRNYCAHVTLCSPMNWNGLNAVQGMREWKAAAPEARFSGCMNIAYSANSPVFESANTLLLQIASAALLGNAGTEIYPGQTMDAENFVAFNRVMGFLGRNQGLIWEGRTAPPGFRLTPLPKEDFEVALGGGRVVRNRYPDWDRESVRQTYGPVAGDAYLAAVVNWNTAEPCYTRIQATGLEGSWSLEDREQRIVYTLNGRRALEPSQLEIGCIVKTPPSDFRGFHLVRHDPAANDVGWREADLGALDREYQDHASTQGAEQQTGRGALRFGYDDIDGDNRLEYKVVTDAQTVWVSPAGHVVRWQAGETTLRTDGFGLCRDQLWLPQSERGNTALNSTMALELRKAHDDHAELVLSRSVPLPSLGSMVDLRLTRRFRIANDRPEIAVEVELHNTSLAMDVASARISYRVHNHLRYDEVGEVWLDDGATLANLGPARNLSVPNTDLSEREAEAAGGVREESPPVRPVRFGEYFPETRQLLAFAPDDPEALLQVLRWLSADGSSGTLEWMYRPVEIRSGQRWKAGYRMTLQGAVAALDHPALQAMAAEPPGVSKAADRLLFHAAFENRADADFAAGNGKAFLSAEAHFDDTPTGRGIRLDGRTDVRYRAAHNIDLDEGRLLVRFMPLWDGTDTGTRYLLQARTAPGRLSVGKIDDGRLLLTLVDANDRQRHAWVSARALFKAGTWYEVLCLWNAPRGTMSLFLDGRKLAERVGTPWKMTLPDDSRPFCELRIPRGAGIVVDDLMLWGPAHEARKPGNTE